MHLSMLISLSIYVPGIRHDRNVLWVFYEDLLDHSARRAEVQRIAGNTLHKTCLYVFREGAMIESICTVCLPFAQVLWAWTIWRRKT
jgi:hypothetical protein